MTAYTRALVTGASSGIGEVFARRLAAGGTALVLVARREDRLEALAKELDVAGEVLAADLADPDDLRRVEERVASTADPVDLLVNNAGFGTTGPFHTLDVAREEEEVRVNVLAVVRLTRAALPGMVERRHGGIVNVSSLAAFQSDPGNAVYGGTKAFVLSFSEAVAEEVRKTGVRVQCLCPGYTRTEFQTTAEYETSRIPKALWQAPEQVVDTSLAALAKGKVLCVPGVHNKVAAVGSGFLPRVVQRKLAGALGSREVP
jgi:short-subunit dehydrogenase